jgi:flagellar protein FlbD
MIQLTRLNHVPLILNSDLIEHVEITPDTVVTLVTGQRFMVLESANEVVELVRAFRRSICQCPAALAVVQLPEDTECYAGSSRE